MKRLLLLTGGLVLCALLIFNSCSKSNVKHPKNIIGKWKHDSWTADYSSNDIYSETYIPTTDCWANSTDVSTRFGSFDVVGTSIHEIYSYTKTVDGVINHTDAYDSTFFYPEFIYSITFKEDGTCIINECFKMNDHYAYTGSWNWSDAYEEKMGLNIVLSGGGTLNSVLDNVSYELFLYISSFDKDVMEFTYVMKSGDQYENYHINSCLQDDVVVTHIETGNYTYIETGKRVMIKEGE